MVLVGLLLTMQESGAVAVGDTIKVGDYNHEVKDLSAKTVAVAGYTVAGGEITNYTIFGDL